MTVVVRTSRTSSSFESFNRRTRPSASSRSAQALRLAAAASETSPLAVANSASNRSTLWLWPLRTREFIVSTVFTW